MVRDLNNCTNCKSFIPQFDWGRGEWYITESNAERGPYCSMKCVKIAKRIGLISEKIR